MVTALGLLILVLPIRTLYGEWHFTISNSMNIVLLLPAFPWLPVGLSLPKDATINDYKSMEQSFLDEYEENLKLQTELDKKNDMIEKAVYNELMKRRSRLKNR
ncbi:hypothetical protein Tco_0360198 [Tanacetum coccineum]